MRKSFDGFLVSDDTMFSSNPIAVNRMANQIRRKNNRLFLLIWANVISCRIWKSTNYPIFFKYQTILQIINLPWRSSISWRMISCSFLFFLLFLIAKPFDSRPNFWQVTTMALCEMLNVSFFHLKVSITGQCRQMNVINFTRMSIAKNDFLALFTTIIYYLTVKLALLVNQ